MGLRFYERSRLESVVFVHEATSLVMSETSSWRGRPYFQGTEQSVCVRVAPMRTWRLNFVRNIISRSILLTSAQLLNNLPVTFRARHGKFELITRSFIIAIWTTKLWEKHVQYAVSAVPSCKQVPVSNLYRTGAYTASDQIYVAVGGCGI